MNLIEALKAEIPSLIADGIRFGWSSVTISGEATVVRARFFYKMAAGDDGRMIWIDVGPESYVRTTPWPEDPHNPRKHMEDVEFLPGRKVSISLTLPRDEDVGSHSDFFIQIATWMAEHVYVIYPCMRAIHVLSAGYEPKERQPRPDAGYWISVPNWPEIMAEASETDSSAPMS